MTGIYSQKFFRATDISKMRNFQLRHTYAQTSIGRHTYALIPTWKPRKLALTHVSTTAERTLLRCCFAQNDTKTSHHFGASLHNTVCRHCNAANETIDHLFLQCPALKEERLHLRNLMTTPTSNPSCFLRNALLDRRFAIPAQRFIASALPR